MYSGYIVDSEGDATFTREALINSTQVGSTAAPKGHFILDVFNRDYNSKVLPDYAGVLSSDVTTLRPPAVSFLNGKLFYATPALTNSRTPGIQKLIKKRIPLLK